MRSCNNITTSNYYNYNVLVVLRMLQTINKCFIFQPCLLHTQTMRSMILLQIMIDKNAINFKQLQKTKRKLASDKKTYPVIKNVIVLRSCEMINSLIYNFLQMPH